MTRKKWREDAKRTFVLSEDLSLIVYGEEQSGFAPMRLIDSNGDFLPVTMNELLNAISAGYYCQKDQKRR